MPRKRSTIDVPSLLIDHAGLRQAGILLEGLDCGQGLVSEDAVDGEKGDGEVKLGEDGQEVLQQGDGFSLLAVIDGFLIGES